MLIPLPTIDVLESITIPTHCEVPWDMMEGDDRSRHCLQCSHAVHDVTSLTTAEVLQLLSATDRLPCLRIFRRKDGRVMTADCPANKREQIWKWLRPRSTSGAAIFALIFLSGCKTATQGLMAPHYNDAVLKALPVSLPETKSAERTTNPAP